MCEQINGLFVCLMGECVDGWLARFAFFTRTHVGVRAAPLGGAGIRVDGWCACLGQALPSRRDRELVGDSLPGDGGRQQHLTDVPHV